MESGPSNGTTIQLLFNLDSMKINTRYFTLAFFAWCTVMASSLAQVPSQIESLLNELKTEFVDTTRTRILDMLSTEYFHLADYNNALKYAVEQKNICETRLPQINNEDHKKWLYQQLANAYTNIGKIKGRQGYYEESSVALQKAAKIYEEVSSKLGLANSYLNIGTNQAQQGNLDEALVSLQKAKGLYTEIGNKVGVSSAYNNMGNIYFMQGNYTASLQIMLASLKVSEELKDSMMIAATYQNIGLIYDTQGNYPDALKNYFTALSISKKFGDNQNMVVTYDNIGYVYLMQGRYDDALTNLSTSKSLAEEIGDQNMYAYATMHIGVVYNKQGKYSDALKEFSSAKEIVEQIGDQAGIADCYVNLGTTFTGLGEYSKAVSSLDKGITLSNELGFKAGIKAAYGQLSETYEKMGDYKNAFSYHKLYVGIKDSLLNESNTRNLNEMKTLYESEKKDREISLLNKDNEIAGLEIKKQKWIKNASFGGIAVTVVVFFLLYRTYQTRQMLKLQTLRNKIASDLHDDVGSTLSSISIFSEIARQQSGEVKPMLDQIGESSRKMLDAMADIVWTINSENDQFEKIILRMRSFAYELLGAKKIDFEFEVDETAGKLKLPMDVRKNLYLIFKEATNNMVKYSEASKASFTISGTKEKLMMLIRDNGKGFDTTKESLGNGLKNMKKRAQEIGAKLLIESEPGNGTTIQLLMIIKN